MTKVWFGKNRRKFFDTRLLIPALSSYPKDAWEQVIDLTRGLDPSNTFTIGSSLGGFWSTCLVEHGLASKAVLLNPSVRPHRSLNQYLGQKLQSYYGSESYCLGEKDAEFLQCIRAPRVRNPSAYWLLAQTGDETLDYRQAAAYYCSAKQTIEVGGTHAFENFERYLPDIFDFLINN